MTSLGSSKRSEPPSKKTVSSVPVLHDFLSRAAAQTPDGTAVVEPGVGALSWRALDELSDRVRDRLRYLGVQPGDRVGLYLRKSIDGLATVYGIMKTGAAYVPVDPDAPAARCALIFADCAVRVIITEKRLASALQAELAAQGASPSVFAL